MDQHQTPIVDALAAIERRRITGFGAPGHSQGRQMSTGMKRLVGARAFQADVLTPKGLDDRTESLLAVQRAHELAAEAWGADLARYATGGSTQSIHTALASVAKPGDTVLIAANAHKAEFAYALAAGLNAVVLPVTIDREWDIEHGVAPETLANVLDVHRDAKAVVIVSPSYYGTTSDIAALAQVAHAHGVPLIVDGAWGGAFAFSKQLPENALSQGADVMVASVHKTMGALAQGSVMLARGDVIDQQRFALAYELFETTSPSTAILASLDATRADHAVRGEKMWAEVVALAEEMRAELAAIDGIRGFGREHLRAPGAVDLDITKVLVDVSALGVAGYAIDDWLYREHGVSVGLSDARNLLNIVGLGSKRADIRAMTKGLGDLVKRLKADPSLLPSAPVLPGIGTLDVDMAMPGPDAFFADVEMVRYEDAAGRIAAEIVAPAPPGVPRLVPGQRIGAAHVAWLVANRDAGAFFLDPTDPTEATVRVVR